MKLYLLRSAEALPGKKDSARVLSPKGVDSLQRLADFLMNKGLLAISEIRHSPTIRASQTANQFNEMSGVKVPVREVPLMEPLDDFRILADIVNTAAGSLLLVGHQPNLGMLASHLLIPGSRSDLFNLKKSSILCLERLDDRIKDASWDSTWQVRWLIAPRLLKTK